MFQTTNNLPLDLAATLGPQLFELSADCMKLLDSEDRVVAMNRNGREAMEIEDFERVRGTPWPDLWPAQAQGPLREAIETARRGGTGRFCASCDTLQGRTRWWDVKVCALPVAAGQPGMLVAVSRDVTGTRAAREERERLFKELQAANRRMSEVFMRAPAFMCVLNGPEHVFAFANERFQQLAGTRDLIGLPALQAVPELATQGLPLLLDAVYGSGEPFTASDMLLRLRRAGDGVLEERYVDLVLAALRDADGRVTGLLVHGIDQTHRKLAEKRLHDSRERFQKIVSQAATGVIEMDVNGTITLVNERFCAMLGYTQDELPGTSILDVTAPDSVEMTTRTLGGLLATGQGFQVDTHYQRKDGSLMPATSSVNALRGADGDHQGVVAIVLDTTERRAAEDKLRRLADDLAEADRRKTEFLATLAHELRNPLAPIRSGLGVMRLNRDLPPAMAKVRDMMERQVSHMVHLIDDLLDVARISGGKLHLRRERVALNGVLASAVETSLPLIEASQHALAVDLPEQPMMVDADTTRIAQVVANLLNNAAKYTPARGRIGLSLRRDGDDAVIAVSDTGVGIAGEALAGVFEMFSQIGRTMDRSQGGLGIGLSLVRRLVEMHGGSVGAASGGANAGSVFTVRLPLAQVAMLPEPAPTDRALRGAGANGGLKILVVDDNVDAAVTLAMILEVSGHATRVAHDGYQALEMARDFRPRAAFLDIGMPGMNGYDTASALRAMPELDGVTLVALTGWGAESDRQRSREAGFDHHLTKPVQLQVVEELLSGLAATPMLRTP